MANATGKPSLPRPTKPIFMTNPPRTVLPRGGQGTEDGYCRPPVQTEPLFAACFNRAYVPHVAAMLRSVAESAVAPSRWYLIGDDSVDDELLRDLADFACLSGLDAQPRRVPAKLVEPFEDHTRRYPRSVWYRAAFAE